MTSAAGAPAQEGEGLTSQDTDDHSPHPQYSIVPSLPEDGRYEKRAPIAGASAMVGASGHPGSRCHANFGHTGSHSVRLPLRCCGRCCSSVLQMHSEKRAFRILRTWLVSGWGARRRRLVLSASSRRQVRCIMTLRVPWKMAPLSTPS